MSVPQRTPGEEGARTTHRLFVGFDSSRTCQVDDGNLYYAMTSPPYWNIENYENPRQMGTNRVVSSSSTLETKVMLAWS